MKSYNNKKIESKWQKFWAKKGVYKTEIKSKKTKYYILDMFPYPSGEGLHVGHPKGYIATDIMARKRRMRGFNVLHPMGFDAFGLPAENYAIKTKTNPEIAVKKNVARYKKQLELLGLDYDWSREVNTTDPKFYKWTQWIFLKLLEKDLAYESNEPVNWCPQDKTVLANEDVEDGKCERCGTPVEKKPMRQWVLKITDYADRLLQDLDQTDYEVPKLIDKVNPHQPGKPVIKRSVAHAIVYDPKNKKYLIIRNKKFGWDTVIIGGIEDGESVEETARREVREETGYVDLEFKRILGGPTEAHYYTVHKGQNRIAIAQAVYFELRSDKRVPIVTDSLTQGEVDHNEVLWIDEKDFVPGKMINSELPIWLDRLGVEVYYDKRNPTVPCFKDVGSVSAYREGLPDAERNGVVVFVKHWKEDKFITLQWKKVAWRTFVTGGIEDGQTADEAALQEVREETGYQNFKFIRNLGNYDATFYHPPKGVNRYGHYQAMYIELKDGKRKKLTNEEDSNHDVIWVERDRVTEFVTTIAQKHAWDTLFLGKKSHFIELAKPLLDWPESIKESQRNWIGRSEGAEIEFKIKNQESRIKVFTTRADTLFGVTYIVLAPEHKIIQSWKDGKIENWKEVQKYIEKIKNKKEIERTDATKEKTGVELKGIKAINPANNEEIPVWIADYVLADYGTGAVMAVPAHDERDFVFAKKYKLKIKTVIYNSGSVAGYCNEETESWNIQEYKDEWNIQYANDGKLSGSREFDGMKSDEARKKITEKFGKKIVKYKLRDWVFSRQRYWGEPIPVLKDAEGKVIPLKEEDLPLKLPKVKSYEPTGTGESPLADIKKWVEVPMKIGNSKLKILRRETNTMPQWAGSSWYYLRYMDPDNSKKLVDPSMEKYWNQVDYYVGGAEHATRHLIYARFWHKFLFDIGVVSTREPFKKLQSVGLIMGEDGRKMSKRFGNVINPDNIVATWGADSLRLYEMFMGPFADAISWNTDNMIGVRRFLERVWKLQDKIERRKEEKKERLLNPKLETLVHKTIKKVAEDIESMSFNTAISSMMILVNEMESASSKGYGVTREDYEILLKLLAPFAPHITEEIWHSLGHKKSVHLEKWPEFDPKKIMETEVKIAVQINGKVRGVVVIRPEAGEKEVREIALAMPEIAKWLEGKEVKKVIFVENKVLNLVVA